MTGRTRETMAMRTDKRIHEMKSKQLRRMVGNLSALGITYGFMWTDISQWGDVLIWAERLVPKVLLWG